MSPKHCPRLLAAVLLLPLLTSCGSISLDHMFPKRGTALIGSWSASMHHTDVTLDIKADNTFSATVNREPQPRVWGTYIVSGNQITFSYTGGVVPGECEAPGTYRYRVSGNNLSFRIGDDNCLSRSMILSLDWRKPGVRTSVTW